MAASISDLFNEPTTTTRPNPATTTAVKTNGASSVTVDSTDGWATATAVHFTMYEVDADNEKVANTQVDYKGIVNSSTTINNLVVTAGTDRDFPIGSKVICAPTAAWGDDLVEGLLVSHDQDGTLKDGAVDSASVLASNVVTTAKILDANVTEAKLTHRPSEYVFDHVASGCVWSGDSYGSTRAASMTSGVVYIGGKRVSVSTVTARTFTASKDTYVDVDNTGTLTYTEVTNNAASPSLASNSIRLGIIVTGASNIANVGSVNQGQPDKVLPIASSVAYSVTDSLGNLICPRDPSRRIIGYRQYTTSQASITTEVDLTGVTATPFIVPEGRQIRITFSAARPSTSVANDNIVVSLKESSTLIGISEITIPLAGRGFTHFAQISVSPTAGLHTYKLTAARQLGTGSLTTNAVPSAPVYIQVELI